MKDFMDFGAVGNGTTNDAAAIATALAAGVPLTGQGRTYGVNGNIVLPSGFYIEDATFKQLTPSAASIRTLTKTTTSAGGTLLRVTVNRNGSGTDGVVSDSAGMWFANTTDLILTDCEVYGDGPGRGMIFISCAGTRLTRPYIHDIGWTSPNDPGSTQVEGIRAANCEDTEITDAWVEELTGMVGAGPEYPYETNGIVPSGGHNFRMHGGFVKRCYQNIDVSGSEASSQLWFERVRLEEGYAFGLKFAHEPSDSYAIDCHAYRCGAAGFVVSIGAAPGDASGPRNIVFSGCIAEDTGYTGPGGAVSGFSIGGSAGGGTFDPAGIIFNRCQAMDRQAVPTMKYGFRNQMGANETLVKYVECQSFGHTTADFIYS